MKEIKEGHTYELEHLDGNETSRLQFVQRKPHHDPKEGTTCQEVIRALIARVIALDREAPWSGNHEVILPGLRNALAGFEARALMRHVASGKINPEELATGPDGHFVFVPIEEPT